MQEKASNQLELMSLKHNNKVYENSFFDYLNKSNQFSSLGD